MEQLTMVPELRPPYETCQNCQHFIQKTAKTGWCWKSIRDDIPQKVKNSDVCEKFTTKR